MKVLFVLIDGLREDVATETMGFMMGLCEAGKAKRYSLMSALPSLSRPLYHCLLGGVTPIQSGIVHNDQVVLAKEPGMFTLAAQQGLITAASAYSWISELYNRAPYDALRDRFTDDQKMAIQHGIFYAQDEYPDEAVVKDGEYLRRRYHPDVLLIHTMGVDDTGHRSGGESQEYRRAAIMIDRLLALHVPQWLDEEYSVIVTSDHGMEQHFHNGTTAAERCVPLFVAGKGFNMNAEASPQQIELCGTVCELLQLKHDKPCNRDLLA